MRICTSEHIPFGNHAVMPCSSLSPDQCLPSLHFDRNVVWDQDHDLTDLLRNKNEIFGAICVEDVPACLARLGGLAGKSADEIRHIYATPLVSRAPVD